MAYFCYSDAVDFASLLGVTITSITVSGDRTEIEIVTADGLKLLMLHQQDCCESVWVEDIAGDLTDLLDVPLLQAESVSEVDPNADESGTWTFYKLATIKGSVTIRWYGQSNGYYSESVELYRARPE